MANFLTMRRLLGFKDFYPNEPPREKLYYANQIGKDVIQKTTPFFLSFLKFGGFPEIIPLLRYWFTFNDFKYSSSVYYHHIIAEYKRIKNFHKESHSILSVESLLNLFLWSVQEAAIIQDKENVDASITLPFLELILLFNDDVLERYQKASHSIQHYRDERQLQRIILAESFSQSDLINIDYTQLLYTQIYKKSKLLIFLEKSDKYASFLSRLLTEFNCANKEEFLISLGSAVFNSFQSKEPSWTALTIKNNSGEEKAAYILENLALSSDELQTSDQDDYLILRNKPYQKIAKGEYRVVFELFLIKKIYTGLIFKLSTYNKDFLANIRNDFSEEILVYQILNSILNKLNSKIITGREFKEMQLEREPDFYYRKSDNIILFESKDFFMCGEKKLSYDFAIIETELKKNGRLKKGVIQLVKNIDRCFKQEIPTDNFYTADNISIFPVLIVHDSLYSAPALNYWIYYWFMDELLLLKSQEFYKDFDFNKVCPITLIEIDTLILYEQSFINEKLDLINLIKAYHLYVQYGKEKDLPPERLEQHVYKSVLSFSEFARDYAHKNDIHLDLKIISEMLSEYGIK